MTDHRTKISSGKLATAGMMDAVAIDAAADILAEVERKGIETLRVLFTDQHGILRGKTIVASALSSVFAEGMAAPSTLLLKDSAHRTVFPVWSAKEEIAGNIRGAGDVLMMPDPKTFRILPWADKSAWILCDLAYPDGAAMPLCTRGILRRAIHRLEGHQLALKVGLEVEFHIFKLRDPRLDHPAATMPGEPVETENIAQGYQFLTELRYDAMAPILEDLRRACQEIGLPLRTMEIEMGPSQVEFTFDPADPMTHADNMVMLRTLVKEVCQRQGLHATFMCRPMIENAAASGWHLHQSLQDIATGRNVFVPGEDGELSAFCKGWIAGLLAHADACCLLTTPTVNGYKRYRPHQLAPDKTVWARDNRGAMIRVLCAPGDSASRIENRVAEPAANPYLYFASQILAGLDGIESALAVPEAVEDPYAADATPLPGTLQAAIDAFAGSDLLRDGMGADFVAYLCQIRQSEWDRYHQSVSAWEQREYFNLY